MTENFYVIIGRNFSIILAVILLITVGNLLAQVQLPLRQQPKRMSSLCLGLRDHLDSGTVNANTFDLLCRDSERIQNDANIFDSTFTTATSFQEKYREDMKIMELKNRLKRQGNYNERYMAATIEEAARNFVDMTDSAFIKKAEIATCDARCITKTEQAVRLFQQKGQRFPTFVKTARHYTPPPAHQYSKSVEPLYKKYYEDVLGSLPHTTTDENLKQFVNSFLVGIATSAGVESHTTASLPIGGNHGSGSSGTGSLPNRSGSGAIAGESGSNGSDNGSSGSGSRSNGNGRGSNGGGSGSGSNGSDNGSSGSGSGSNGNGRGSNGGGSGSRSNGISGTGFSSPNGNGWNGPSGRWTSGVSGDGSTGHSGSWSTLMPDKNHNEQSTGVPKQGSGQIASSILSGVQSLGSLVGQVPLSKTTDGPGTSSVTISNVHVDEKDSSESEHRDASSSVFKNHSHSNDNHRLRNKRNPPDNGPPLTLGVRHVLYCNKPNSEELLGFNTLCGSCRAFRLLPEDYFPRYINEVTCFGQKCIAGGGDCMEKFVTFNILRNIGTSGSPNWTDFALPVSSCCNCMMSTQLSDLLQITTFGQ